MATKRFCDICDNQLTEEDDRPFIRVLEYGADTANPAKPTAKAQAHVMVMNEGKHILTDVCNGCKLKIVNTGEPMTTEQVATLQPSSIFPTPLPTALPPPPPTDVPKLERSLKPQPPQVQS